MSEWLEGRKNEKLHGNHDNDNADAAAAADDDGDDDDDYDYGNDEDINVARNAKLTTFAFPLHFYLGIFSG